MGRTVTMGRRIRPKFSWIFCFAIAVGATIQVFLFGRTLTRDSQEPHALPDRVNMPQYEFPLNTPQDELPLKKVLKEARDRQLKEAQGTNERADHAWQWQPQRATAERVNEPKEARDRELKEALDRRAAAAGGRAAAAKPAAGGAKAPNAKAPSSVNEGSPVKCHGHIRREAVYRYTGGELRPYPNQAVARSWDANWSTNVKRIDCSDIPEGPDMSWN